MMPVYAWRNMLGYYMWNSILSSILFVFLYLSYISQMDPSLLKFGLIYACSLVTGIIGSLIAMVITGIAKFEWTRWKAILLIPLIYTVIVFLGLLNLVPLSFTQSMIQNVFAILYILIMRIIITIIGWLVE